MDREISHPIGASPQGNLKDGPDLLNGTVITEMDLIEDIQGVNFLLISIRGTVGMRENLDLEVQAVITEIIRGALQGIIDTEGAVTIREKSTNLKNIMGKITNGETKRLDSI